jgi:hypothetical protein
VIPAQAYLKLINKLEATFQDSSRSLVIKGAREFGVGGGETCWDISLKTE